MQCIITKKAENDLESIADYIALDNPVRAGGFVIDNKTTLQRNYKQTKGISSYTQVRKRNS